MNRRRQLRLKRRGTGSQFTNIGHFTRADDNSVHTLWRKVVDESRESICISALLLDSNQLVVLETTKEKILLAK
jgi:hypothetical protein